MSSLTESAVLERIGSAFDRAALDRPPGLARQLVLEEIDGLDSVSRVRLMMSVEDTFGIEILPRENSGMETIGDLVHLVLAKSGRSG
jgi:acyl carrier protein